jgi:hypothetical protein
LSFYFFGLFAYLTPENASDNPNKELGIHWVVTIDQV